MYSLVKTCILEGLEGRLIDVEIDMTQGLPACNIVGLAGTSIKESVDRVRSSISNSGYEFPMSRITINLAPANIRKEGSQIDLAIAIGILKSNNTIYRSELSDIPILGELSLDGRINKISGGLPIVIALREKGYKSCIIPVENYHECDIFDDFKIIPVTTLRELVEYLNGQRKIDINPLTLVNEVKSEELDFKDVKGQESLKRVLEITAAGGHNVLVIGPPGSGKTMSIKRLPGILPDLTKEESIEVTKIYSICGMLEESGLIRERPFRSPHHTAPQGALIGGGRNPMPGEVSFAHNGILFLDELPEFKRDVLEVLRQPLEDGLVKISRLSGRVTFPADFIMVAAMNPCKCGYYGSKIHNCTCTETEVQRYLNRISNPLLDRIDLHIEVEEVNYKDIKTKKEPECSATIKKRVDSARAIQIERYKTSNIYSNSQIKGRDLEKYCPLKVEVEEIMKLAYEKYKFSLRTHDRILRVARTIADLEGAESIESGHILEAISYRSVKEKY